MDLVILSIAIPARPVASDMPSRDPHDLHPELRKRWEWMRAEWKRRHPDAPQPFLTTTHRPANEQQALVNAGKSRAKPMQSLHNFQPALAFDVAFDPDATDGIGNDVTWNFEWFERWGELAEEIGLEWGGRWDGLVDGPHVQWPTTWRVAQVGNLPDLPPLPSEAKRTMPLYNERNDYLGDITIVDDRKAYLPDTVLWSL